jgi:4-hydroxy-3-polyprenylbenzoate decarboxylase
LTRTSSPSSTQLKYRDLRQWLELVGELGELRVVRGASSEEDIGRVAEMLDHTVGSPCVLFDAIPGYAEGYRVVVNTNGTIRRQAVTLGLDPASVSHDSLMTYWRKRLRSLDPIQPREVSSGPIFENVQRDGEVDINAFPAPIWHPKAGGRYIGTASLNIMPDPDSDWINVGSYRNQILDSNHLGLWISPGKHGRILRDKHFKEGKPVPIVVVVGSDPLMFMAACSEAPSYGLSEFAWAGAVRGEPVEVVRGEITGLPIPAQAEIAFEGFVNPTERRPEGPYGEAYGYYSVQIAEGPFVEVKRAYFRNDPIILGCPQGKPPHEDNRFGAYLRSCSIWDQLEHAGVPDVKGVSIPPEAGNRGLVVVSIQQRYPGHARQAALVASQVAGAAYLGRYVIIVDDDIDIWNFDDIWWAVLSRCDPQRDIEFLHRAWSGPLDQAIVPEERGLNSRAIIDATIPWEWRDQFPPKVVDPEIARATREQWGWLLGNGTPPGPE